MHHYLIQVCLEDGSVSQHHGLFGSDWDAIDCALSGSYGMAMSVVVHREVAP